MAVNNDEQQLFIEALENLKEYAKVNCGIVTRKDILDHFKGIELLEGQLQIIYGYLENNKIKISDVEIKENKFEKINTEALEQKGDDNIEDTDVESQNSKDSDKKSVAETEEDRKYIEMYLQELGVVKMPDRETLESLLEKLSAGEADAADMFVEGYLQKIVGITEGFKGQGVAMLDLIQEGNLELMLAVKECSVSGGPGSLEEFDSMLENRISEACNILIEEHMGESGISKKILNRVNAVNDCAVRLSHELGRKVTAEEVGASLGISEQDVREAVRFSSDKIEDLC